MIKKIAIILSLLLPQLYGAQSRAATSKDLGEMEAEGPPDGKKILASKMHTAASNRAINFLDQGNHLAAFYAFEEAITLDIKKEDAYARVQVAENLIYGISGALVPNAETKDKAARATFKREVQQRVDFD